MANSTPIPVRQADARQDIANEEIKTGDLVEGIVSQLTSTMNAAVGEIRKIHLHSHFLSVNASIEAERANAQGAAFSEVAKEVQRLSAKTELVADEIEMRTKKSIDLVCSMAKNLCGTRLADIALNSLDLIDRNLYERTCDVRWWATDSSIVSALQNPSPESAKHACDRLSVILAAYTVYLDIVLCDSLGNIIANGRSQEFASIGKSVSEAGWFEQALLTESGDNFAFQSSHKSDLVDHHAVLIYSAAVRKEGRTKGSPLGVLGVIFNWTALASAVLANASLSAEESARTLRFIVNDEGNILACSKPLPVGYRLPLDKIPNLLKQNKGYAHVEVDHRPVCIAFAKSPGFETYATGWNAILIQELS